ncbi:MAG: TetR/AcrR family transcriptional regulator [Dehalococcoidia bacterium]|nr:TetR/AcrR family transcriptional regulator [Dehalococcoidia bacterium]
MRKRSANKAASKAAIIEVAIDLFWENGYNGTSLRDIAEACGFEAANLYNYFRSKEQLLYEAMQEELERFLELLEPVASDSRGAPVERLKRIIEIHVERMLVIGRRYKMMYDSEIRHLSPVHRKRIVALRDYYSELLLNIIEDGKKTGDFAADIDARFVVLIIASIIMRTVFWFSPKGRLSPAEIADMIYKIVLDGIRPRKQEVKARKK